jgi:peptide/nickel transport system substrate-binding protein
MAACRAVAAFLIAAALSSCVSASHRGAEGDTLVFTGLAGEPDSLNPMLSTMSDVYSFSHLYLSYLVECDDRGRLVPEIARSVPTQQNGGISADGKTIVYHLRRGVYWQDGVPLTARDVVFTFHAVMNPANDVPTRVGYDEIASVRAAGSDTVVVRLRRPFAPITAYFFGPQGLPAILPAHLLARYRSLDRVPYNQLPVGSGPFRVVAWRHGDSIALEANPRYWRGRPKIDRIVYRIIPDPNTRLEQLQTGEADAYFDVDPLLLPQLRRMRGIAIALTPVNDVHFLRFNMHDPVLADPRIRRAIAMAIDRPRLIEAATHGSGSTIDADQPRNSWAYDPAVPPVPYDPNRARRLLGGRRIRLVLAISPQGINGSPLVATVIQQELRSVGIDVTIKSYPFTAFYAPASLGGPLAGGRYQLAYDAWWVMGPDPDDSWNFACDQMPPHGVNYYFWCNRTADAAMHDALRTYDRARRIRDYAIVQREVARDLPEFSLWQVRMPNAYSKRLHGVSPSPFGSAFWNAWSWTLGTTDRPANTTARAR